jgi:hypothetical protein
MKKIVWGLAAAVAALFAGVAIAQVQPIPTVLNVGQSDYVQIIPGGVGSVPSVYAQAGRVASMYQYSYQVPLTGFTITPPNGVSLLYLNPAGTLATGTLTMPATPGDGTQFCIEDSQTQTALTVSANTGQSMAAFGGAAVTALTANTKYCWFYIASQAVWVRLQ